MGQFNPLIHNCERDGCFNKRHRPRIEDFGDCWPGKIGMGDLDGIVEVGGHFLVLEWKSVEKDIPRGQDIMYKRMTVNPDYTVVVVCGDAETMTVKSYIRYRHGERRGTGDWEPITFKQLFELFRSWATLSAATPTNAVYAAKA